MAELMASLVIFGICLTIVAQLAYSHLREQMRMQRKLTALEHASDLMEELRSRPWEQLDAEIDERQPLSDERAALLRDGYARIRVLAEMQGGMPCRRLEVEVVWNEPPGPLRSVQLVAFRCPRQAPLAEAAQRGSQERGGDSR